MSKREQGAPFLHADSMRSRCGRDRPGAGAKKRSASTPEAHVVGCEPAVGEADPVSHNAAATAAGEPSKTNSPKINRRRRGPKRGPDSRAPRARARMSKREQGAPFLHADSMRSRCGRDRPGAGRGSGARARPKPMSSVASRLSAKLTPYLTTPRPPPPASRAKQIRQK